MREFVYRPSSGFTVTDELETLKPAIITSLLHADGNIERVGDEQFSIKAGAAVLKIEPSIAQQSSPPGKMQSTIEVNVVTAPGPPGAVDKGEQETRGQKLLLSNSSPTTKEQFILRMWIEP